MFSKALLDATYVDGNPTKPLSPAHYKAEHHRFKQDFLFKAKEKAIPKELYASRLIQQFLIIKALETKLANLSKTEKAEISAFFALSYFQDLWRTSAMADDLRQFGVDPDAISPSQVVETTNTYLKDIEHLSPKLLLGHFLLHVAGFMHGGNIIQSKYIRPSNRLTTFQIPAKQYDFSTAISCLSTGKHTSMGLYVEMMKQIDEIVLNDDEYKALFNQCTGVYERMVGIYDDLCDMHTQQPKLSTPQFSLIIVSLVALGFILKLLNDCVNTTLALKGPSLG